MRIRRLDLGAGDSTTFSYIAGDRYIYISKGLHPDLKPNKPVKLEPGQDLKIATDNAIQVSCMYE